MNLITFLLLGTGIVMGVLGFALGVLVVCLWRMIFGKWPRQGAKAWRHNWR